MLKRALAADAVVGLYSALQFGLAAAVGPRLWPVAGVFVAAGAFLALGVARRSRASLVTGAVASLAGPLAVGLGGLEEFHPAHHAVRLAVVTGMLVAWHRTHAASATSPAQRA